MKINRMKWFIWLVAHSSGVLTVVCVVLLCFVTEDVARAFLIALDDPSFYSVITVPVVSLVGVSMCLWALLWITGSLVIQGRRDRRKVLVVRARGTIMTEFLIVMPIYLLLTSGLAQLSINSTAQVLTSLATFQAGRTAWIWEPETRSTNARNGATRSDVDDRARIAAASVLAPVVPAEFRGTCEYTAAFDETMRSMTLMPASAARALTIGQVEPSPENRFYNVAFDNSVMMERGAKKFFMAYCHTSVSYRMGGKGITTKVEYDHANVFPWFAYLFGEAKVSGGRTAYYSVMKAEYSLPLQTDANPRPARSLSATFGSLMGNLGI